MNTIRFDELDLNPQILRGIADMGFEEATPIQSQAIPVVLSGVDVIGQAQTGTGKTAAFGIPILQKVDPSLRKTQVLILSPTRELAIQVADEIRKLAKYMHGVKVLPVYGGQDISRQIKALKGGVQIIIGTPGRLLDHLRRKTIRPDFVHTIVLDEADEMLNMGFREDIETVLEYIPGEHQTVLFSATMPKPILDITRKYQHDAVNIKVVKKELTVANIDQYYYDVKRKDKVDVLTRLLDYYNPKLSLVFCNTKKMVDELATELSGRGYSAEGLHGDMKQSQRDRVMNNFRKGKTDILIATDVAARGIDVDDVEAVFNYDLPQDDEYYVHRIGRTGRAGRCGKAFSFVKGKEVYKLKDIQRYCKTKILAQPIPSTDDVAQIKAENIMEQIGTIIEEENLSDMIELIEKQVNEADYTAESWAVLQTKIEAAEAVVNNADATNYDVQLALANLVDAISGLEAAETPEPTPADKDKLTEVVNNCAGLEEKNFTADSWKVYKAAYEKAMAVLADENASQADVDAAVAALEEGKVIFFAGGTGHPYFSTDTGAVLRAIEIEADAMLLAKAIDGIYDSDPKVNPAAVKYDEISIQEVIDQKLAAVDLTASILCLENKMPMLVFGLNEENSIVNTMQGKFTGTKVTV